MADPATKVCWKGCWWLTGPVTLPTAAEKTGPWWWSARLAELTDKTGCGMTSGIGGDSGHLFLTFGGTSWYCTYGNSLLGKIY